MATENFTDAPTSATLTEHDDGSVTLSSERQLAMLNAAWELEGLALTLPQINLEGVTTSLVIRSFAARMMQLSSVIMGGLQDDLETVEGMERVLYTGGKPTVSA